MGLEEAVALCDAAIAEVRSRLAVAPPSYLIKIVDKDGARVLAERKSAEVRSLRRARAQPPSAYTTHSSWLCSGHQLLLSCGALDGGAYGVKTRQAIILNNSNTLPSHSSPCSARLR